MIKDVVILTGEPPVLTSQLGAESLESPDIFVTSTEGWLKHVVVRGRADVKRDDVILSFLS